MRKLIDVDDDILDLLREVAVEKTGSEELKPFIEELLRLTALQHLKEKSAIGYANKKSPMSY